MQKLTVKDVMTGEPVMIHASQTVMEAARLMGEVGCGILPVGQPEKIVGIVTDRDIVLRVVTVGEDPAKILVREIMSPKHYTCPEDAELAHAAEIMREHKVSRLLVTKDDNVTGIVTLADLLRGTENLKQADSVVHALLGKRRAGHAG